MASILSNYLLCMLSLVFLVAGATKLLGLATFARTLQSLGVSNSIVRGAAAFIVPSSELYLGIALLVVRARELYIILLAAAGVLMLFSLIAFFTMRAGRDDVRCQCFGPLSSTSMGRPVIRRNLGLLVVAAMAMVLLARGAQPASLTEPEVFIAVMPIALSISAVYAVGLELFTTPSRFSSRRSLA